MVIGLAETRELLKKAVETKGRDFAYNPDGKGACLYRRQTDEEMLRNGGQVAAPQTTTGCIVGVVCALAEIPKEVYWDNVTGLLDEHNPIRNYFSKKALSYLTQAQQSQDMGGTWGYAYDFAEKLRF